MAELERDEDIAGVADAAGVPTIADIATELPDAELVFAFVSPLGTPTDVVQEALEAALARHQYSVGTLVRLSEYLDGLSAGKDPGPERPASRQERLMDMGSELRREHGADHLAMMAVAAIATERELRSQNDVPGGSPRNQLRSAHIVRSLKHPDEVARLRHIYGKGFFLLGISASREDRLAALIGENFPKDEANRLLDKDAAEAEKIGQQTRRTFELADAFIRVGEKATTEKKVDRLVDLIFSCPFHPPTREEHAMFMAYSAAMRSGDLSRQVGAVITNATGDVIASGANDAPAFGGENYRPAVGAFVGTVNPEGGPDYVRGYDSNERERNKILVDVLRALVPDEVPDGELTLQQRAELVKRFEPKLKNSGVLDLTEFGRAVHAEMAALSSCTRTGVSPARGTLYCTTFPCHNCAKHIVAAGLETVIYIEPYPKSKARDLHGDSICFPEEDAVPEEARGKRVSFRAFEGIGPRRFIDLFSLTLGSGRPIRRKAKHQDGARVAWEAGADSLPRLPLDPRSYLERETAAAGIFRQRRTGSDILAVEEGDDGPPQPTQDADT